MIEGKASLVIDLGNSETRVATIFGRDKVGKPRQRISVIHNKFGELFDEKLLSVVDYNEENSKVFKVGETVFCSGLMCDREKGTSSLRPSASMKKYESNITLYTLRLALLQGYQHLAEIFNTKIEHINVEWKVSVLLPPSDLDLGKDALVERIKGLKEIEFLMPAFKKDIVINEVRVFPEGFCAYIGLLFADSKQLRDGATDVLRGTTLVADIGAGTTDLNIIEKSKLVDVSRYSEETGGNQVFQKINMELRKKYGKNFAEDSLRKAAVTGKIQAGAQIINITQEVENAKKAVATKLSSAIRNYLESIDYSLLDINYVLICGGGAEEPENENMKSLGQYIKEDLGVWMKYSKFLEMPKEEVIITKNGVDSIEMEKISPRLLNIRGAAVLSEN